MNNRINSLVTLGFFLSFLIFLFSFNLASRENSQILESNAIQTSELEREIESLYNQVEDCENTLYGVGGAISIPENLTTGDFVFPIAEEDFLRYTSPFGLRKSPLTNIYVEHQGVDIATVWRAQVVSVADGVVVESWPPPGAVGRDGTVFRGHPIYGGMLRVRHENGLETLYAHLSYTYVYEGLEVKTGQVIGRVGNTGRSVGQHLHFEMSINDNLVNPMLYLSELPEFEEN